MIKTDFIRHLILILFLMMVISSCDQNVKEDQGLIENLMKSKSEKFKYVLESNKHEVQIIYTQINRDSLNNPSFKQYQYRNDQDHYFYPASTVKMPIALLALEKLNELSILGLDKYTTMLTDSAYSGQSQVLNDSTSRNGVPSIAHYIKKIFIASDNDAYNRLYEFLGQEYISKKLKEKGYNNTQIIHRLSIPLSIEENKNTNPIRFVVNDSLIYQQPLGRSNLDIESNTIITKGLGYIDQHDVLVNKPFEFTYKNTFALADQQKMLKSLIFKDVASGFNLTDDDYTFLLQYMSQLPNETLYPNYAKENHPDGYCKFLMFSNQKKIPTNIRIFNKIGQAYGFMTDNAYIVDLEANIEFLLSAVISVNENQIYNDGVYEYETIGDEFMQNIGHLIYNYEKQRVKDNVPDLSAFRLTYDNSK